MTVTGNNEFTEMLDTISTGMMEGIKNTASLLLDEEKTIATHFTNLVSLYQFLDYYDLSHINIIVGTNKNNSVIDFFSAGDESIVYCNSKNKKSDRIAKFKKFMGI